jgi:transposase InsO family protein
LLGRSSPDEYRRNCEWSECMDPFWTTKAKLSLGKLNIGDVNRKIEIDDEIPVVVVEDKKDPDDTSEWKEPRADNVHYAGLFANKNTERAENGYATVFMNKHAPREHDDEVRSRKKKQRKKLMNAKEKLKDILSKYEKCFAQDPSRPPPQVPAKLCKHVIELKDGCELGRSPGMRVKSEADQRFIKATTDKLLAFGLIKRVQGAAHASQVHIAKVPGRDPRFCLDYRQVNDITKPDPFPLPRMDELLYSFKGATIFSTLDAQKGFWQIKLGEGSEHTAFRTKDGVFEWTVMPMGLMNAPATFQRFMDGIFEDLDFVKVYIDDIIIASKNIKEHLYHIEQVLKRCLESSLTLKVSKCHFLKRSIKILGYYVSANGITQDPEKLEAIQNFAAPRNLRELRRFLGMLQFFRMFSSATARILVPLYTLCRKAVKWKWEKGEIQAFREAKEELMKRRTLAYPDVNEKFYVSVDASDFAFGANLYQFKEAPDGTLDVSQVLAYSDEWTDEELDSFRLKEKVPHVVESFSKKWNKHEVNYTTSEKECLAIVNALERWSHYLAPKEFEVWSDHKALQSLVKTEKPRLKRWKLRLTPFTFDLKWKAGRTMKDVDTLSRDSRFQTFYTETIQGYCVESRARAEEDLRSPEEEFTAMSFTEIECHRLDDLNGEKSDPDEPASEETAHCFLTAAEEEQQKADDLKINEEVRRALVLHSSNFRMSQRKDPRLCRIMKTLESKKKKSSWTLRDDGVLLNKGKIAIPKHEIPMLLWMVHDHPLSGHVGKNKMLSRLTPRFYWHKMRRSVTKYIKGCACAKTKARKGHKVGRTIAFTHYGPLDCLQFDLVGPFPTSKGKNCYWLTMIDRYTRAVELVAVESKESKVVAKAIFENWISRYGAPLVMLSDNEFRNNILKEVCKLTKTKQIHTAPYRPSTNGLCERVHSFAINMLQNATDGNIRNWDTHLPAIRFAIMTSCLDGFGFSPYQLLFGRRPRLPIDLQIPYDTNVSKDVREYFNINMEAIRSIRETFDYTQSKVDARMRYRRDLSQRRRPSEFQVGDLVYHTREYYGQDPVQRGLAKLLGKFEGPSLITKRLGENTYEVQVSPTNTKVFNVEHLALYKGEDPPIYRPRPQETTPVSGWQGDRETEPIAPDEGKSMESNDPKTPSISPGAMEAYWKSAAPNAIPPASVIAEPHRFSPFPERKRKKRDVLKVGRDQQAAKRVKFRELNSLTPKAAVIHPKGFKNQWVLAFEKKLHSTKRISLFLGKVVVQEANSTYVAVHVWKPRVVQKVNRFLPYWYRLMDPGSEEYETKISDRSQELTDEGWKPWIICLRPDEYVVTGRSARHEESTTELPERFVKLYRQVWDKEVPEVTRLGELPIPLGRKGKRGASAIRPSASHRRSKRLKHK